MMHAVDDIERIRREGTLTYIRAAGGAGHPDQSVVEYVGITLSTPSDATDRCVGNVVIEWVPHFANAALAPRVKAQAGNLKMLALFPEILSPVFGMRAGHITPDEFVRGLDALGVRQRPSAIPFVPSALKCVRCNGIFDKVELAQHPEGLVCTMCAIAEGLGGSH